MLFMEIDKMLNILFRILFRIFKTVHRLDVVLQKKIAGGLGMTEGYHILVEPASQSISKCNNNRIITHIF